MLYNWEFSQGDVWAIAALLVIFYTIYSLKDYFRIVRFVLTLGGPPTIPLIGNAYIVADETLMYQMSHTAYNEYGPIFRIWMTAFPAVVLFEPADIQVVLSSSKHLKKTFIYRMLHNFIGDGLITSESDRWKTHRKLLQPAFHLQILERFTNSFAECADHLVKQIDNSVKENVNLTKFINDSVINILNETVLGVTLASKKLKKDDESPFRKGQVVAPYRIVHPWLLVNWIYDKTAYGQQENAHQAELFDICRKMIGEKREAMRKRRSTIVAEDYDDEALRKTSLLEFMVEVSEKNPTFKEDDIINECCTFMLAGQDSVGSAAAVTIALLAANPDWQNKCVEELAEIFGNDPRCPTIKDLKDMRCLEMCIKESLRLYPSVPAFARKLGEDTRVGKYVIPAGCDVFVSPYATHRLPHHFPDPHTFNPARFDPQTSEKRHPYAYIPFSAGPRNCIGYKFAMLEMKAMISAILRKFQLQPVPGKEEILPKFRLTLRIQGGLWVNFKTRPELVKTEKLIDAI